MINKNVNLSSIPDMPTDDDVLEALISDADTRSTDSYDIRVHNNYD